MRIAFLAPHIKISGGVRILLTYASLLSRRGHKVTVYVQSKNSFRRSVSNFFQIGLPSWIPGFAARVVRIPEMSSQHIKQADVLIATTWQTAHALAAIPASHGRQYYLVQHDEGLYHGDRAGVDAALSLPQEKIVVSTWLHDILKERYHQESSVLINPVDEKLFYQTKRTAPTDTVRVLLLHHTYAWKGTAEGAEVILRVKKRHPEVRFIMFGAREKDDIPYPCDEYHYKIPQDKLADLYSNTDIYLCPSWEEGFGLPSVEAMRSGAALVTYDNGGSQDFAQDGKTAFVAPHRDLKVLEEKLELAVSNTVLRENTAKAGKLFVEAMPTWGMQVEAMERILT